MKKLILILIIFQLVFSCKKSNNNWENSFEGIVSSSSPQCTDLTGDGIKDIVIGGGGEEWERTDSGIIAINGATGQLIWKAKARNQIVGSAVFLDINLDKVPDVLIGGRSAELQALDGRTGKLIWEFYSKKGKLTAHDDGWYNFFNPQICLDQDSDGIKDIIICNGGDALIPANSLGRPPGKLLLLSGKTGKIIAQGSMPDSRETYFSPICYDCDTNKNPTILFGSGGETEPGHLYLCLLSDLKNNNLKASKIIDSSLVKGFISPPILCDFNQDDELDILVNLTEGVTKLINGKTFQTIWKVKIDSSEIYSQAAIGNFSGNDKTPDVFVNFAKGVFPTYSKTLSVFIDGKTGKVLRKHEGLRFTYSSPLTIDLNDDGTDEVVMTQILDYKERDVLKPYYQLSVFDTKNEEMGILAQKKYGACFASTPWIGDLDHDGKLDVVYCGSPAAISEFPGTTTFIKPPLKLDLFRYEYDDIPSKTVKWGNYLGNEFRSIYK